MLICSKHHGMEIEYNWVLYPVEEKWHSQEVMPHHNSLHEFLESLAKKEIHFRFRKTSRSIERLYKFLFRDNWNVRVRCKFTTIVIRNRKFVFAHGSEAFTIVDYLKEKCSKKECRLEQVTFSSFLYKKTPF